MSFIQTARLTFHYVRQGAADGVPMLLLHSNFGSSRWWRPLLELLPDEIAAYAPDLRGCGQSEHSDSGYEIEEQAEDIASFVDALQLTDFDLVAHSSSGPIAIEYVLRHPGRVRSLTLVDSAPIEGVFSPLETLALLEQMRSDHALLRQALAQLMPSLDIQANPLFDELVADAAAMAPAAFTAVAASLNRWNRLSDARTLALPALVIWGELDTIVSREATMRTLTALPGANNMEILAGVGHSPMLEDPLALAERLIDFTAEDFTAYEGLRARAFEPT